jgi:hypothetical protein
MRTDFSGEGTRTLDTADMSRMLYHLSYAAVLIAGTIAAGGAFVNRRGRSLPLLAELAACVEATGRRDTSLDPSSA